MCALSPTPVLDSVNKKNHNSSALVWVRHSAPLHNHQPSLPHTGVPLPQWCGTHSTVKGIEMGNTDWTKVPRWALNEYNTSYNSAQWPHVWLVIKLCNSEQCDEFLLSQPFSVTQKFNLIGKNKKKEILFVSTLCTAQIQGGGPLHILALKHVSPLCKMTWWFYPCTRPLAPTAAWVWWLLRQGHGNCDPKILLGCFVFFGFFLQCIYLQHCLKNTIRYVVEITKCTYFSTSLHLQYVSVGMLDLTCCVNQAVTWYHKLQELQCLFPLSDM